MTHRVLAPGSRPTGRPLSGYSSEAAVSPAPDPSYATTSPAHRKTPPSIFPIKRDTTDARADQDLRLTHRHGRVTFQAEGCTLSQAGPRSRRSWRAGSR
jgi:hypothetical protein